MYKFEESTRIGQIPDNYKKHDYSRLYSQCMSLQADEALKLSIKKEHVVSLIRRALDKRFGEGVYVAKQRTIDNKLYCFIHKNQKL